MMLDPASGPPPGSVGAPEPMWRPSAEDVRRARLTAFLRSVAAAAPAGSPEAAVRDYPSLYRWSIDYPDRFWPAVWRFCGVIAAERPGRPPWDSPGIGLDRVSPPDAEAGPHWFPGARLNFAENLLRFRDNRPAIVAWNEAGPQQEISYAALHREVARVAWGLSHAGIGAGDRVCGYLPNVPEAVIAMLATASLGAIWSSCSPDLGPAGVVDRFGQISPRLLFCADGYQYAGKEIDSLDRVRGIARRLPALESIVVVPYRRRDPDLTDLPFASRWDDFGSVAPSQPRSDGATIAGAVPPLEFVRLPFDHPLYIMYSSGTTGLPKCLVHGAGGTLLQHLKELVLHTDLRREDRIFYYTTCGWMMWNWLVSSLAVGATVVLYDGAPFAPGKDSLWEMAARERITIFGTSARYIGLCEKEGLEPRRTHHLSSLRAILSTGSPLDARGFDYVYERVAPDVRLSSISGGTDIISCFALGNPIEPVWRGELQTRGLGMAVQIFDELGRPLQGEPGELVCTRPFPSMPIGFWDDADGSEYRATYFSRFPNVWRHGDWAELTEHDGLIVLGRSDTTLNPGGVRIGTAEIYREVERLPEVLESVVVEQEIGGSVVGARETAIVLYVRLRDGLRLEDALRDRIRRQIRDNTSPHHVPKRIVQVSDIPRTISGKISEVAVREAVHGRVVRNLEALQNPEAVGEFVREVRGKR